MAGSVLLLWMPVFHSAAYLSDEIDVAFTNGKGTEDTPRLIVYIFIYAFSGIWTGAAGIRLKAVWNAIPERRRPQGGSVGQRQAEKCKIGSHREPEGCQARGAQARTTYTSAPARQQRATFNCAGHAGAASDGAHATAAQGRRGLHAAAAVGEDAVA